MSSLGALVHDLRRHRELALGLARAELTSPFAGSAFGIAWAVLHPLLQMAVYLVVFTLVFRIRIGAPGAGVADAQTYMLSGMLPWMVWAGLLPAAAQAIVGSASLVRQADFPAEVLPARAVLTALVPHLVGLAVLLVWIVARRGELPWTVSLLPVVVVLGAASMLGVSLLLASFCVFVRDVKEVVTVLAGLGIFLVPAFYTPETVAGLGPLFAGLLAANPFTHFVHVYRDCLYFGGIEHPVSWLVVATAAIVLPAFGYRAFQRLRIFFGNFL